ncbi:hypothetical protein ABL78_4947 [Leptomonas seymouri]|uniref:Uncharacterized protein n=1 Tax=Leptomonas seymouri TaxID=5684 RepID=A0A0N1I5M8_LEPSE|nr:hypothetical protein ABL78_4947 [Leptomonas seymouri]|eukprot:KPI85985.1 hypothetical protein ABL78_4947 [Leptomonas seymouri]
MPSSRFSSHPASGNPFSISKFPRAASPEINAEMLDALLSLSISLYEDEALASPATASIDPSFQLCSIDVPEVSPEWEAAAATTSPKLDSNESEARTLQERATGAPPHDAYAAVDPGDLMDAMKTMEPLPEENESAAQRSASTPSNAVLPGRSTGTSVAGVNSKPSSTALTTVLIADEVPLERKVIALMDAVSKGSGTCKVPTLGLSRGAGADGFSARGAGTCRKGRDGGFDASSPLAQASSLLLAGLDMQAVLTHGEVAQRHLRHLTLSRCDFSRVRWSHVTVEDCDLSRCIFYDAALHDVVFRRCSFAGCLMKGVRCDGQVLFEDCEFRLAAVGMRCSSDRDDSATQHRVEEAQDVRVGVTDGDRRRRSHRGASVVRFLRCDFDLSDFQHSSGLTDPATFSQCTNAHLASRFPLRARGGIS